MAIAIIVPMALYRGLPGQRKFRRGRAQVFFIFRGAVAPSFATLQERIMNTLPHWWQEQVIYPDLPKSFQDTTGSGTGDLRGVTQRLDYLKTLGIIDAIWLTPFTSPRRWITATTCVAITPPSTRRTAHAG